MSELVIARLRAELDRIQPVYDAAVRFREALRDEEADCVVEHNALMWAVDLATKVTR